MKPERGRDLELLLDYLKRSRGFDFTGYKRPSLTRRVNKRMQAIGVKSYEDFIEVLERDPAEFDQLCNTVLINVTAFFRDGVPWESLASDILPRIMETKREGEPIRVWSAGCASGEEAYTLAIVLAEAMGEDAFRERVKIYATDVDEQALTVARHATYAAREVEGVPAALLEKYFERLDNRYTFRKDLRRLVIFGRNDLIQDAPISRIDLLVCRNTLMYFNAATQSKILARFHFALTDKGFLFLGRAETLLAHNTLFAPIDLKRRIFVKVPKVNYRTRLLAMASPPDDINAPSPPQDSKLRDSAWDANPVAQIVVDASGALIVANERARTTFNLGLPDIGRPFQDLEVSYRPAELRSVIEQAYTDRKPAFVRNVEWSSRGDLRWMDIQVTPIFDATRPLGVSISFNDVTAFHHLHRSSRSPMPSSKARMRSFNRPTKSSRRRTKSCNPPSKSWRQPMRSSSRQTKSWRP